MGQYAKAAPRYERGLKIREKQLGGEHPDVAESLNNLAWLYGVMDQYAKAVKYKGKGLTVLHKHQVAALNTLSEKEQQHFLFTNRFWWNSGFSFALERKANAVLPTAEWVLNGKALGIESQAERMRSAWDGTQPQAAELARKINAVRQEMARLTLATPKPDQASTRLERLAAVLPACGAKSILATLWKIPDIESTQLMTTFFNQLSQGLSPPRRPAPSATRHNQAHERCRKAAPPVLLGRVRCDGTMRVVKCRDRGLLGGQGPEDGPDDGGDEHGHLLYCVPQSTVSGPHQSC